jgi:hypothetical protein
VRATVRPVLGLATIMTRTRPSGKRTSWIVARRRGLALAAAVSAGLAQDPAEGGGERLRLVDLVPNADPALDAATAGT